MSASHEILVFASKTDPASGHQRARNLVADLKARGLVARCIHKLSSNYIDLELVARHRILHTPTVLVLREGSTLLRLEEVPWVDTLLQYLSDA